MSFLSSQFMNATFTGITDGLIFALIALSLVLAWQATHVLNFAQGALSMLCSYVAVSVIDRGASFWVAFAASMVVGFCFGGATERFLIKPLRGKPEINPIVAMVGLLVVLEAVAPMIWGPPSPRPVASPFSQNGFVLSGETLNFSPTDLFTMLCVLALAIAMWALFNLTDLGLRMRAAARAPEVARLLGVRVNRLLTLGWALAGAVGAVCGLLAALQNGAGVAPTSMDLIFVFGFIAAAMGGLESPAGALAGGLITGLVLAYVSAYWSSGLAPVMVLVPLMAILMTRPQGLFSQPKARRV